MNAMLQQKINLGQAKDLPSIFDVVRIKDGCMSNNMLVHMQMWVNSVKPHVSEATLTVLRAFDDGSLEVSLEEFEPSKDLKGLWNEVISGNTVETRNRLLGLSKKGKAPIQDINLRAASFILGVIWNAGLSAREPVISAFTGPWAEKQGDTRAKAVNLRQRLLRLQREVAGYTKMPYGLGTAGAVSLNDPRHPLNAK